MRASIDVAIAARYYNRRIMADDHHENDEDAAKVVEDDLLEDLQHVIHEVEVDVEQEEGSLRQE